MIREAQLYVEAIIAACDKVASKQPRPSAPELLSAIIAVQGQLIAGISDEEIRKEITEEAHSLLDFQIQMQLEIGAVAPVKIYHHDTVN